MKLAGLNEVLAYKNEEVISRFSEDYKISVVDAEEIFQEMLKWLWLCGFQLKEAEDGRADVIDVPLLSEIFSVDLMWHTFILFTRDYAEFCEKYFATFIHHIPQTRQEKESWKRRMAANPTIARQEREDHLRAAYELIYDQLGPTTLSKWVEEFPEKFLSLQVK